jgi:hypothetical protein
VQRLKSNEYPKPSPGEYGIPQDPTRPREVFGKFGKDPKITKFIQDEVVRSRCIPGPGAHEVQESMAAVKPFCPEGGRCLAASKPPSYFDAAVKQWEGKPDPGAYEVKGSVNGSKAAGRLVYKYESATIGETKAMVNKVSSHDTPGPGSYNLPDPAPLGQAPVLKGRGLGHAMPHPYAYNCAPDYGRKFDIVPVRQDNSADMIYGTGRRPKFTGAVRSPSSAGSDRPSPAARNKDNIPEIAGTVALDLNAEDAVQWRSGGFAALRKVKSTGAIKVSNPMHEELKRYYPAIQGQKRDKNTIAPGQIRKSEVVSTHDNSVEYQRLQRGKIHVAALSDGIKSATEQVLEPLDLHRLRQDAMDGLVAKARYRMRMEGVAKDQEEHIIAEMRCVLAEKGATGLGGFDATAADDGSGAVPGDMADNALPIGER